MYKLERWHDNAKQNLYNCTANDRDGSKTVKRGDIPTWTLIDYMIAVQYQMKLELIVKKSVHKIACANGAQKNASIETCGIIPPRLQPAFDKIKAACNICRASGRLAVTKKTR